MANARDINSETALYEELKPFVTHRKHEGRLYWNTSRPKCEINTPATFISSCGDNIKTRIVSFKYKRISEHRFIYWLETGVIPESIIHLNGNTLDNRFENLKACTHQETLFGRKMAKHNLCGFKGVFECRGKYRARITYNGKRINLGSYSTPEEAHEAYKKESVKLFGEFAKFE